MPPVAVIVPGNEIPRQPFGDVEEFFKSCLLGGSRQNPPPLTFNESPLTPDFYVEERTAGLLAGLDSSPCACVVFASNGLVSAQVRTAVEKYGENLWRFVKRGGGIIVLHQFRGDLPEPLQRVMGTRQTKADANPSELAVSPGFDDDVLLNFPHRINPLPVRNPALGFDRLYWQRIEAVGVQAHTVITGKGCADAVLTRTRSSTGIRSVECTVPLDWRGDAELMRNLLAFAVGGIPKIAVGPNTGMTEMTRLALGLGRAVADTADLEKPDRDEVVPWVVDQAELCVVSPEEVSSLVKGPVQGETAATARLRRLLERGGTVAAPTAGAGAWSELRVLVGPHAGRRVAEDFAGRLAGVTDWGASVHDDSFSVHALVSAHDRLMERFGSEVVPDLGAAKREKLKRLERDRGVGANDVGSALGRAYSLLLLGAGDGTWDVHELLERLVAQTSNPDPDLRLVAAAVAEVAKRSAVGTRRRADDDASEKAQTFGEEWLNAVADLLDGEPRPSAAVRLCAAADLLERHGLLPPDGAARALEAIERTLDPEQAPGSTARSVAERGWFSPAVTAEVTLGLIALHRAAGARTASSTLSRGASFLRAAYLRREVADYDLPTLARMAEALVEVERAFPVGIDRLSLPTPKVGTGSDPGDAWPPESADRVVEAGLTSENVRLHAELEAAGAIANKYESAAAWGRILGAALLAFLLLITVAFLVAFAIAFQDEEALVGTVVAVGAVILPLILRFARARLTSQGRVPAWLES